MQEIVNLIVDGFPWNLIMAIVWLFATHKLLTYREYQHQLWELQQQRNRWRDLQIENRDLLEEATRLVTTLPFEDETDYKYTCPYCRGHYEQVPTQCRSCGAPVCSEGLRK